MSTKRQWAGLVSSADPSWCWAASRVSMLVVFAMLSLPWVMPIALVVGLTMALVVAAVVVTVVLVTAKLGWAMATGWPGAEVGPSKLGGITGAEGLLGGSDDWVPYSTHWMRWVGNSLKCWMRVTC